MSNNAPPPPLKKRGSVLGTGLSGLVGSRIVELLSDEFDFADLSYDTGVDITNREQVAQKIAQSRAAWILHMAAKADVDGCETDKAQGKEGAAWKINVEGTRNIIEAAKKTGKRVLYISTDFVFSGRKEFYTEEDMPEPVNWYGVTKYEGEKIVLQDANNLVVRITYPYRAKNPTKRDFVHTIVNRLQKGEKVIAVTDQIFTPTLIDDIAQALRVLSNKSEKGVFHVVGNQSLSPFKAAELIAEVFSLPKSAIDRTTCSQYYRNRAPRPCKLATKNAKITSLGVRMHTFLDGLEAIKRQGIK